MDPKKEKESKGNMGSTARFLKSGRILVLFSTAAIKSKDIQQLCDHERGHCF